MTTGGSIHRFLAGAGDARERRTATGVKTTVGALGDAEPLLALPAAGSRRRSRCPVSSLPTPRSPSEATATRSRRASPTVALRHRLGSPTVEVHSPGGGLLTAHRLAPPGAGSIVRSAGHHAALERVVLSTFTTARPCDRKANRPPGPEALAAAAALLGNEGRAVIVDLAGYAELTQGAS